MQVIKKVVALGLLVALGISPARVFAGEESPQVIQNALAHFQQRRANGPSGNVEYWHKAASMASGAAGIKVLVVYYFGPAGSATRGFAQTHPEVYQANALRGLLDSGSKFHGTGLQSIQHQPSVNEDVFAEAPQTTGGIMDYGAIMNAPRATLAGYSMCQYINTFSQAPIQVWLFTTYLGHGHEWAMKGAVDTSYPEDNMPFCGKQYSVLAFAPISLKNGALVVNDLSNTIHVYNHMVEGLLQLTTAVPELAHPEFGCAFANPVLDSNLPSSYFYQASAPPGSFLSVGVLCGGAGNGITTLGFSNRGGVKGSPPQNVITTCGDVHFTPNTLFPSWATYDYANTTTVQSTCDYFATNYQGSVQTSQIGCAAWGCTAVGYQVWWQQRLPGRGVLSNDVRKSAPSPAYRNWWDILWIKSGS